MSRGPVEVVADLGTVKVVPFGADQVQLRCRVKLGRGEPLETVLLLDRTRALQIADGLTSGDLAELIAAARAMFVPSDGRGSEGEIAKIARLDRLAFAAGKFR